MWAIRASRSSAEWSTWAGATLGGRAATMARTSLMRCETLIGGGERLAANGDEGRVLRDERPVVAGGDPLLNLRGRDDLGEASHPEDAVCGIEGRVARRYLGPWDALVSQARLDAADHEKRRQFDRRDGGALHMSAAGDHASIAIHALAIVTARPSRVPR